jgi:hypothetical protein
VPPNSKSAHRVFVNCPFSQDHRDIFDAIVFTLAYYGFNPVLAQHRRRGGRLEFILRQLRDCEFSVHDITPVIGEDGGARRNTAFELGLWWGAGKDGKTLVFTAEKESLRKSFSDLDGHDFPEHAGGGAELARKLAQCILSRYPETKIFPKPQTAQAVFKQFSASFAAYCKKWGWRQTDDLSVRAQLACEWIEAYLQTAGENTRREKRNAGARRC